MSKWRVLLAVVTVLIAAAVDAWMSYYRNDWVGDLPYDLMTFLLVAYVCYKVSKAISDSKIDAGICEESSSSVSFELSLRRVFNAHLAFFYPERTGACLRCYAPWVFTTRHKLPVPGLFGNQEQHVWALCDRCHKQTHGDVGSRVGYYGMMFSRLYMKGMEYGAAKQVSQATYEFIKVRDAVLAEYQEESGERCAA